MLGFMETIHGLPGPNLDLILHSPGGSGSAAEQIVKYLRTKFDHIRNRCASHGHVRCDDDRMRGGSNRYGQAFISRAD
jgi:hypothetical protein